MKEIDSYVAIWNEQRREMKRKNNSKYFWLDVRRNVAGGKTLKFPIKERIFGEL